MESLVDTRVKLLQILLTGISVFWMHSAIGLTIQVILLVLSLCFLHLPKQAAKLGVYFLCTHLLYNICGYWHAPAAIGNIFFLLRKMTPLAGIATLFLRSITVSQLIAALSKLHMPKSFILALAITLRFVPTITAEVSYIKDSLALRGRPLSVLSVIRAPLEMTESVLLPLMMRGVKIADELSASAVSRGIENPHPRTFYQPLAMRWQDWLYMVAVCVSSVGLFLFEIL